MRKAQRVCDPKNPRNHNAIPDSAENFITPAHHAP